MFNLGDDVFIVSVQDTGEVLTVAPVDETADVCRDLNKRTGSHHFSDLSHMPCKRIYRFQGYDLHVRATSRGKMKKQHYRKTGGRID
ncbi:hypothetical protein SAMN06297251_11557 [Fulvimarina manganoxydans]|uniref:Uncharacterized protein n=1 Tax=Fulvimarina manganoxydans TaxID=937218 RepID=A0A1W2DIQ5_9HYPH|nr:hypothetical protein [Fulvimarina manganoxydans]SMC96952.1 hypothetical protein SAMN06297251_11557 [Fulvimarina manganoxydans]